MSNTQQIENVVRQVVQSHFETEEDINEIIWFKEGEGNGEIRLIEINPGTLPTGSVEVLRFALTEEIPFPVRIADVTPQEWQKVQQGEIPLPAGWSLEQIQIFQRLKK